MNVLVIGSGGREHALVWKLAQSPRIGRIYCTPGNPGILAHAEPFPAGTADLQKLAAEARTHGIGLTVVGPEQPLAEGIVDIFRAAGLRIFGPTSAAAELEWSKAFAKDFMRRHNIPTARFRTFRAGEAAARSYVSSAMLPLVVKADGLAAGKGVTVCRTRGEALGALADAGTAFGAAGSTVVVEEFMEGVEASLFAVCDGTDFITLAPAQDHKRALDGDRGPNTGGMGAYAPAPCVTAGILDEVCGTIIRPTLSGMAAEGRPYTGCLYAGLMLTAEGPRVVEFNCRFGDPETQVVLPLFGGDLLDLLEASAAGSIASLKARPGWALPAAGSRSASRPGAPVARAAVCVVLASGGYPGTYETGKAITGLPDAGASGGVVCFHAGTRRDADGSLRTAGGRVLGVTALEPSGSIAAAVERAYIAARGITFEGIHYRHDIGKGALI